MMFKNVKHNKSGQNKIHQKNIKIVKKTNLFNATRKSAINDSNGIRTHKCLALKRALNHLVKLFLVL